jgi:hypothetical protein
VVANHFKGKHMIVDWIEPMVPAVKIERNDDLVYSLYDLSRNFKVVPLDEDNLYCVWEKDPDVINEEDFLWGKFAIMKFRTRQTYPETETDNTKLDVIWHGKGPISVLRELRHSYFGDNGYIFYVNRKDMELSFEYLSKYYDME